MKNSTAISLLKLIKQSEWADFKKFASSPFFNKGRNYDTLISYLLKFRPAFDSDELTKRNIYNHLYPRKKFKESVVNTIFSGLSQICEEFILYQDFRSNQQREMRLLRQYCKRGHKSRADKLAEKLKEIISSPASSGLEFYERLEIFDAVDFYYSSYDKRNLRNRHIVKSLLNLQYFFILQTFVYSKELLAGSFYSENNSGNDLSLRLMNEINFEKLIDVIVNEDPENSVLLKMYSLVVRLLSNNNDDRSYEILKGLVVENLHKLEFQTGKYLLLNLQVINVRRLNEGRKKSSKELYEISKILIDGKYYDKDEYWFRPSHFRTIVRLGINSGDIEYIEKFVEDYHKRLEPGLRQPLKHFALANICFAKKMYDTALSHIAKAELKTTMFKIDSRRITAKIYYETNSTENLQSLIDAFSHYLKNIRTADQTVIKRNLKFLKYLKKLIKLRDSKTDSFEFYILQNEIMKENVSEINWLLEKVAEIGNKINSRKANAS